MAVRTLRLGEELGQLPMLAERIAGFMRRNFNAASTGSSA